jgi:hypothetical protein
MVMENRGGRCGLPLKENITGGGGGALDKSQSPLYGPTGKAVGEDLVE